jgi:flagellar biosynthetic protein FliR
MERGSLIATGLYTLAVASRLAPILALTPLLNSFRIPATARMLIVIALALALAPAVTQQERGVHASEIYLICSELLTGICLALAVHAVFAAFSIAGRMVDNQSGLAMGSMVDPVSKSNTGVLGQVFTVGALAMFFALDGHLGVLRLISVTYDAFPVGSVLSPTSLRGIAMSFSGVFGVGLTLVAPIVMALFLADVVLGITSRSMPQINVLLLATPIKSLIAVALISITCRYWSMVVGLPDAVFNRFLVGLG